MDINNISVTLIDVTPESLIFFSNDLHVNHKPTVTFDTQDK